MLSVVRVCYEFLDVYLDSSNGVFRPKKFLCFWFSFVSKQTLILIFLLNLRNVSAVFNLFSKFCRKKSVMLHYLYFCSPFVS